MISLGRREFVLFMLEHVLPSLYPNFKTLQNNNISVLTALTLIVSLESPAYLSRHAETLTQLMSEPLMLSRQLSQLESGNIRWLRKQANVLRAQQTRYQLGVDAASTQRLLPLLSLLHKQLPKADTLAALSKSEGSLDNIGFNDCLVLASSLFLRGASLFSSSIASDTRSKSDISDADLSPFELLIQTLSDETCAASSSGSMQQPCNNTEAMTEFIALAEIQKKCRLTMPKDKSNPTEWLDHGERQLIQATLETLSNEQRSAYPALMSLLTPEINEENAQRLGC